MTAAKPEKGIARKPMRMQMRDKKFKRGKKYTQRRLDKSVKKLLTNVK